MPDDAPPTIYFNAASHGLPDETVRERMRAHLARESEVGPHRAAMEAAEELAAVRARAAALLGAETDEIAFGSATTLAWGQAMAALPLEGRRILVAPHEWVTNLAILRRLEAASGMTVESLPLDAAGDLDVEAMQEMLDEDVAAICVPMVSSLTGRRYPVEEIGALPRPDHCFFAIDAAQALGQVPIDVKRINCDLLAATARKWLRAPRGTALLYVARRTLDRMKPVPFPDSGLTWHPGTLEFSDGAAAARFEGFDANAALRLGLGAAIEFAQRDGAAAISEKILSLALHLRACAQAAGIALFSPAKPQSGITTLRLPEAALHTMPAALEAAGMVVKFPALRDEPLAPLPPPGEALLRISPHVYNTPAEINALFTKIAPALRKGQ